MLDDFDAIAFERGDFARMIRQQPDATKIKIEQDLSAYPYFTLYAPAVLRASEIFLVTVKSKLIGPIDAFECKSKRVLV